MKFVLSFLAFVAIFYVSESTFIIYKDPVYSKPNSSYGPAPPGCPPGCPYNVQTVFTTDGTRCIPKRNQCWVVYENNCYRKPAGQPLLRPILQADCQRLCPTVCRSPYQPVCADFNNNLVLFANQCEMDRTICSTGNTYLRTDPRRCGIRA